MSFGVLDPAVYPVTKGHGTENDFVIVEDPDGRLEIDAETVRRACDRRAGIGGDGVLRVVRTVNVPGYQDQAAEAEWFMDYRNSDGSVAEMYGNGSRVFALYLVTHGLAKAGEFGIGTRGGVKHVRLTVEEPAGDVIARGEVTVDMGVPVLPPDRDGITVEVRGTPRPAVDVDMGNPHAVVFVDSVDDAGDLHTAPRVSPDGAYPEGVNIEFAADAAPRHLTMRVHERGSGETRSCGTGACAVMIAAARRDGAPAGTPYTVDVPGGRLRFVERADGHLEMTGPAVLLFTVGAGSGQVAPSTGRQ